MKMIDWKWSAYGALSLVIVHRRLTTFVSTFVLWLAIWYALERIPPHKYYDVLCKTSRASHIFLPCRSPCKWDQNVWSISTIYLNALLIAWFWKSQLVNFLIYNNFVMLITKVILIMFVLARPLQINFLFPIHHPHLFPVNTKNSIISVFFHYLRFFSYTLVEYNRCL